MDQKLFVEMNELENKHWWFIARREIIRKFLELIIKPSKKNRILEIGCGTGGNLDLLSNFGIVYATELNEKALELAKVKQKAIVRKGGLPHNMPYQKTFDLICMFDVLEHIEKDFEALNKIPAILKSEGKLVLTVPAFQCLWSHHDVLHQHYRRYTKKELTKILENQGFEIEYSSYFNTFLFPLVFLVRKLSTVLVTKNESDITMPGIFVNKILKFIFASEKYFIPKVTMPYGVSIIVIAKNKKHSNNKSF